VRNAAFCWGQSGGSYGLARYSQQRSERRCLQRSARAGCARGPRHVADGQGGMPGGGGGLGDLLGGALGGLLGGAAAGTVLNGGLGGLLKQLQQSGQG